MSFFKIITDPVPTDPSVLDTDFKTFYPAVQRNMAWETLAPYVEQAEERYIIPFISREFYDELNTEYNGAGIADADKAKCFRFLKFALANYTMMEAMPVINIRIGDAGIKQTVTDDTQPAAKWAYSDAYRKCIEAAYQNLDMALLWAETQVKSSNTAFDTFRDSEAYTESIELLIPNAQKLNAHFYINRSRQVYVRMRPYIEKAEDLHIKPLLGDDMYQELKTQITTTLSTENQTLLKVVQKCLTSYAVVIASAHVNLTNKGNAWKIYEAYEMTNSKEASKQDKQQLITEHEQLAIQYAEEVKQLLYANLDSYPTFRDSPYNELADEDETDDWFDDDFCNEAGAVII